MVLATSLSTLLGHHQKFLIDILPKNEEVFQKTHNISQRALFAPKKRNPGCVWLDGTGSIIGTPQWLGEVGPMTKRAGWYGKP